MLRSVLVYNTHKYVSQKSSFNKYLLELKGNPLNSASNVISEAWVPSKVRGVIKPSFLRLTSS